MTPEIINITKVEVKANYILNIEFADGLKKQIDCKPFIKNGVSSELKNEQMFNSVKVEYGTLVWPNGYDMCPVFLREYIPKPDEDK